jgi:hypothetical protein
MRYLFLLNLLIPLVTTAGFVFHSGGPRSHHSSCCHPICVPKDRHPSASVELGSGSCDDSDSDSIVCNRRHAFLKLTTVGGGAILSTWMLHPSTAGAAATNNNTKESTSSTATIWLTGKAPKVPGQAPKDKSDTQGTKRDPNFLRSISDCKSQCEQSNGPDGYARSKEECLELCQDICCKTYEQCTFAITPR